MLIHPLNPLLSPFYKWARVTQIWNKQQCLTVCAVNGLKKEQLASTDGEESRSGIKNRVVCTDLCSTPPAARGDEHCVNWHNTINTNSFSLFTGCRRNLKEVSLQEDLKWWLQKQTWAWEFLTPSDEAFLSCFKGQTVKDLTLNPRRDPCRHPVNSYVRSLSAHPGNVCIKVNKPIFFLHLCFSLFDSSTGDAAS